MAAGLEWWACFSAFLGVQTPEPQFLHLPQEPEVEALRRAGGGWVRGSKLLDLGGDCSTWGSLAIGPAGPPLYRLPTTPGPPSLRPRITNIPRQPTPAAAAAWEGGTTADSRQPPEMLNPFAPGRWSPRPRRGGKSQLSEFFSGSGDQVR